MIRALAIVTLLFASIEVFGHARLINPAPRSPDDGIKINPPCGGIPRGANGLTPPTYEPGSQITVQWQETINHPGRFLFYLSSDDDQNFVPLVDPAVGIPDNQNDPGDLPHSFTATLTLPAGVTCENCTLQMIQQMRDDDIPSYYYSCADIRIAAGGDGGGGNEGGGTGGGGDGGQGDLSGQGVREVQKPGFGCGLVGAMGGAIGGGNSKPRGGLFLFALPFFILMLLRARRARPSYTRI